MGVFRPRLCLILCKLVTLVDLKCNVGQLVYDIIYMTLSRRYTGYQSASPHGDESFTSGYVDTFNLIANLKKQI